MWFVRENPIESQRQLFADWVRWDHKFHKHRCMGRWGSDWYVAHPTWSSSSSLQCQNHLQLSRASLLKHHYMVSQNKVKHSDLSIDSQDSDIPRWPHSHSGTPKQTSNNLCWSTYAVSIKSQRPSQIGSGMFMDHKHRCMGPYIGWGGSDWYVTHPTWSSGSTYSLYSARITFSWAEPAHWNTAIWWAKIKYMHSSDSQDPDHTTLASQ